MLALRPASALPVPSPSECLGGILLFDFRWARNRNFGRTYLGALPRLLLPCRLLRRHLPPPDLFRRIHRTPAVLRSAVARGIIFPAIIEAIVVGNLFSC